MNGNAIKICGVRFVESAIFCVKEGADFIGLVFHPKSKRNVEISSASKIAEATYFNGGIPVAVVADQNAKEINKICDKTGIKYVQLHGDNAAKAIPDLSEDIVKILAVKVSDNGIPLPIPDHILSCLNPKKDFLLYDGQNPGSGVRFAMEMFYPVSDFNFFIAGGLNAENVEEIIGSLNPYGVDVSSGVETEPGVKDPVKIKEFIKQVKKFRA